MNEISVLIKKKKNKGLKKIPRSSHARTQQEGTTYRPDSTVYQDIRSCPKFGCPSLNNSEKAMSANCKFFGLWCCYRS